MARKFTTYTITSGLDALLEQLHDETGIPDTVIYKMAVKSFYQSSDHHVMPELLVTPGDPDYIVRDVPKRTYVDEEMQFWLKDLADYNHCPVSTVFLHALLCYVTKVMTERKITF